MTDETLSPTETPAGIERIGGTDYEYPYRVEDFQGAVIRDDLDRVPPFLNQEQIDILSSHLSGVLECVTDPGHREQQLATIVYELPDSEHGRYDGPEFVEALAGVRGDRDE